MSYTNETTNLKLPQYIGTDIPSILTDVNGAYAKIDTAYGEQNNQISESTQNSEQAKSLANAAQAQAQAASNEVASVTNRVKTLETNIDGVEEVANTASDTANAANTAAGVAKNTADTALSNATTAQSTANTALNNANTANATANNVKTDLTSLPKGRSGVVASVQPKFYSVNRQRNISGITSRLWYSIEPVPAYGAEAICMLLLPGCTIDTGTLPSVTVESQTLYPFVTISGNIFNQSLNSVKLAGRCILRNSSTMAIQSVLTAYLWCDGTNTYIGVYGLSSSDSGCAIDNITLEIQTTV